MKQQSNDDILAAILDEFMESVRQGEQPNVERFIAVYPQLELQIRELLPLVSMVEQSNSGDDSSAMPSRIGEYSIISELGRGGMGVVYRAFQQSLNRDVALKVLPSQATDKSELRERFQREATAAASLHHTNIVPVFEVGEADRVSFYAMQFINGETLHEVRNRIREIGTPNESAGSAISDQQARLGVQLLSGGQSDDSSGSPYYRSVAKVGIQAADALHHAHCRGIVHRDIKPSNLILDRSGVVWLTDFGLAKTESDDLTRTGHFPGTLRYMSPERFKGECTPLSDIYALGATLYELLTLRPAFEARDHMQLIEQIGTRDPINPREIDRQIPRDLETIVLKAMEKEPRRRYQNAFKMMEDLRRFCAGEPIQARSVTSFERAIKWTRRRPGVTLLASLLLIVGTAGFGVSSWKWAEAAHERDERGRAQKKAEENLQYAQEAIERMLSQVGDRRLANIPRMEKLRRDLLMDAVEMNRQFITESQNSEVLADVAETHARLGRIFSMLGETEKSLDAATQCRDICKLLNHRQPENIDYRLLAAKTTREIALGHLQLGNIEQCVAEVSRSIELAESCVQSAPGNADCAMELFTSYGLKAEIEDSQGAFKVAIRTLQEGIDLYESLPETARQHPANLLVKLRAEARYANLLFHTDKLRQANEKAARLVTDAETLLKEKSDAREALELIAGAHEMNFITLKQLGQRSDAHKQILLAIACLDRLVEDYPHIPDYESRRATMWGGLAVSYAESGEYENAEKWFDKSMKSAKSLVAAFPGSREFRYSAARATRMLGIFYNNSQQLELAISTLLDSVDQLEALLSKEPNNPDLKLEIAKSLHTIGTSQRAGNQLEGALESTRRAIELEESVLVQLDNIPIVRHKLAQEVRQLGELLNQTGQSEEAGRNLQRAIEIARSVVADAPDKVEHLRHLSINLQRMADWMVDREKSEQAILLYEEAIMIRKRQAAEQPEWFQPRVELPDCLHGYAEALINLNRLTEAGQCYQESRELCQQLLMDHPNDLNLREDYARSFEYAMKLEESTGNGDRALSLAEEAFLVRKKTMEIAPDNEQAVTGFSELKKELERLRDASGTTSPESL